MHSKIKIFERKLTAVNTIEYGLKLCQGIMTIVNCTYVRLKVFKMSTAHINDVGIADKYVAEP